MITGHHVAVVSSGVRACLHDAHGPKCDLPPANSARLPWPGPPADARSHGAAVATNLSGASASGYAARCDAQLGGGGRAAACRVVARPGAAQGWRTSPYADGDRPLRPVLSRSLAAGNP